ncbi:LacI family DNA-binding transcriptional regulator [Georgenia halophila]|uniref:LacI family DNA-binding transcriptional regulator n=1 Tax=Georgenia halophila TaxID=620889 RepID=A0ABP8LND2_9MICO
MGTQRVGRPTITDIAKRVGVSTAAVSFALNGRPGVSEHTRKRILEAVDELNWHPNRAARALSGKLADTVGLVVARPARTISIEPFFAQLLSGLQARLSADMVALQLLVVEDMAAEIATYRRWAAEGRVDGLVLLDLEVDDPRPEIVAALGPPAVLVGGAGSPQPLPAVSTDDFDAMLQIIEHLVGLGHRRVGHVGGIRDFVHSAQRVAALEAAARDHDLDITSIPTDFSHQEAAAATTHLVRQPDPPTAIVFDSDIEALAGVAALRDAGMSIPDDVSVASFDDSELARLVAPPLTAMTRDAFALGGLVAEVLVARIRGAQVDDVVRAPASVLTPRASTGPVPASS